jgi:serine protease
VLALKTLRRRSDIESVELNTILRPSLVPSDPLYTLQWHYPMIGLPQAWDATTGSADVVVAVVDTGVVLSHPDLAGQLVPGYDFISSASRGGDGDGIDPDPDDPGDLSFGGSSSFHGTHVAGTIGAASDNERGIAGVAWGARVMPVRVLGFNGGTAYDVLQGVRFAAGLPNDSATVPPHRADVINLSLTGGGFSQIAQDLFDDVRQVGTVVVGAAGNEATSMPSFPASYDGVLSVSAVDLNRRLAPYSNYGAAIDLAAPGGDTSVDRNGDSWADGVLSTLASDAGGGLSFTYSFYQGTSMAAPHVAGVIALMKSVNPTLTPAQVDTILASGLMTEDLGAPGRDGLYGYGLIDANAAVLAAGAVPSTPTPTLAVTPAGLSFGLALVEIEVVLSNASQMPVSITSISNDSGGWLAVAPIEVDANGLGRYHATVDRDGLAEGSYAATISIVSSAGTTNLPVLMRVGGPVTSDAGYHFVALVDAETLQPLDELGVAAVDGTYDFQFENVPEGDYLLIAGTDLDNDGFICDGGEACGSYPTLDGAVPIHLDADVANVTFGTGFRQSIVIGNAGAIARGAAK